MFFSLEYDSHQRRYRFSGQIDRDEAEWLLAGRPLEALTQAGHTDSEYLRALSVLFAEHERRNQPRTATMEQAAVEFRNGAGRAFGMPLRDAAGAFRELGRAYVEGSRSDQIALDNARAMAEAVRAGIDEEVLEEACRLADTFAEETPRPPLGRGRKLKLRRNR